MWFTVSGERQIDDDNVVVGPMMTVPLRGRQDGGIYFYRWRKLKSSHAEILTRKCWHQQQSRNCVMSGTA
jgi:hypothetical protein